MLVAPVLAAGRRSARRCAQPARHAAGAVRRTLRLAAQLFSRELPAAGDASGWRLGAVEAVLPQGAERRWATRRCWWSAARTTGWCRGPALDRTAARYGGAPLLFPGMGHDLMLDARWAEPIDAILDWLEKELAD